VPYGQLGGALGIPRLWRGSLGRGKLPIRCPMIGIAVRLSPWLRRRGSRSCDTPMAGARRPCSPARPGERRRHPSAVEAPIRLRGCVPSAGGEGGSDRAFCRQGRLHSSSRPSSRRTGPGQPCHATRQRESRVRSIQRALSLIQCSSLSYDYPTGGKVRAHPFRPPSGPVIHPACGSPWAGSDCCAGALRRHITLAISQCVISRLRHVSPQGV